MTEREALIDVAVRQNWDMFDLRLANFHASHIGTMSALAEQWKFVFAVRQTFYLRSLRV